MSYKDEQFNLNWKELKLLIEISESQIRSELNQSGQRMENIGLNPYLNDVYEQIKKIKDRLGFNEKLNEWKEEKKKSKNEEEQKKINNIENNVKKRIKELSNKYSRLLISELVEDIQERSGYIIKTIEEMIEKEEIKARYFKSTSAIVFEK